MLKKIVGIIERPDINDAGKYISKVNESLRTIVSTFDVILLGILPMSTNNYLKNEKSDLNVDNFKEALKLCDGFILQGGIIPCDYEMIALEYAYRENKPVLGVCMGMQNIGLFLGGKLALIEMPHNHKSDGTHSIVIKEGSFLADILEEKTITVNSRHLENIVDISEEYVAARCENVIEAVEDKMKRFFLGVQWHPEDLQNEKATKLIFGKFIEEINKGEIKK